jgi:TolB-like protein/class 3 adenylate cyclase/Flp pilus assembly protein TadD
MGVNHMATQGVKRKLTAILSADVEGYSRLMEEDEAVTVETLTAYRETISSLIQQHRGRVVDSPGDNLLAEFASVVDAVQGAVEIQELLKAKNAELPENRRMQFRIGINLGDVIEEGHRIYGDGVNIASRIEALADPGGICIAMSVYNQIKKKLVLDYEDLGEHTAKNISEPIRVYRVPLGREAAAVRVGAVKKAKLRRWQWATLAVAMVIIIVAGALVIQYYVLRPAPIEPASLESMAVPLPDKPSIAVLPFDNISGDPEQEYFSDGMTDDIITDLSKISDLFVVARNSVFKYKGQPVDVNKVGRELGVRYVLEGSVRIAENMVRINAQLIDTTTGGHLWAERYEGPLDNIFSLQEKITRNIAEVIAVRLTIGEKGAIPKRETDNLVAYLTFLKGWQYYLRFNPDNFLKAIPLFEKAIELDPNYWHAYAALAKIYMEALYRPQWWRKLGLTRSENYRLISNNLTTAMNGPTPLAYEVATQWQIEHVNLEGAIAEAKRAVSLDPTDFHSHFAMGQALLYASRHREAAESFKRAMRLDSLYQDTFGYGLGKAYFFMVQYEKAVDLFERALKSNPGNGRPRWFLAAAYAHLGRVGEAEDTLAKIWEEWPQYKYMNLIEVRYIFNSKDPTDLILLTDGLRKAGME